MNIFILIVFVIISLIVFLYFKKASKGVVRDVNQLKRPIEDLLNECPDGWFLIIEHVDSNKFIQYSKYVLEENNFGVELGFPDADWSHIYYEILKQYCDENKIEYSEETPRDADGLKFLNVNFGKNIDKAYLMACEILLVIFGLTKDDKFHVRLRG